MEKSIVTTGKTIDLAIEAALAQLGLDRDSVSVQVLAKEKAGFLGFGATPAKVQVTYEAPDVKPEAPKSALGSASRSNKPKKPEAPKQETLEAPKPEAPKAALVAANIVAALLFAAGHLPATFALFGRIDAALLFRCFLLNGGFGLMFGYLFRKYGIQYAMLSHISLHIISQDIWFIFI